MCAVLTTYTTGESKRSGERSYFSSHVRWADIKVVTAFSSLICFFSLSTCSPLLGSEPTVMCVEGLECMNDDPTSVDVLFAKVFLPDHSDRFA